MGELLDALHALQEIELKLAEFRRTDESKLRRIAGVKRTIKKIQDQIDELRVNAREVQMQTDSLNLDMTSREETINRHREALAKAKTNKEYASILTALNTEKADNTKIETQILELMEQAGALSTQIEELEAEKTKYEGRIASVTKELEEFQEETKDRRVELEREREACAESIPAQALNTFSRVAEHHDGEAMVPIEKIHPKREDYICLGCNMTITLEVINALRVGDELQFCKTCGRLLFIEDRKARARR